MIILEKKFLGLAIFIIMSLALNVNLQAQEADKAPGDLEFCGEKVPLERPEVYEDLDQDLLLLSEARARVWLTLRRQGRYLPIIEKALKEAGLPADLKYLAMSISSLAPDYKSGGHRGIWRLTEAEASNQGLMVNKIVDERLDPVASSRAAASRLKSLGNTYGNWILATAAYLDEEAIITALSEAGNERNYFRLYVPETLTRNLSLVLAGKLLFSNPGAYGYRLNRAWTPLVSQRITLSEPKTLKELSAQYKMDYKTFRDQNQHILTDTAPAGTSLNIP